MNNKWLNGLLFILCATVIQADVTLSRLFSDHMVLQRGKSVPVWGTAAPGEGVTVTFAGQSLTATADSRGEWRVDLSPMAADTTSRTMTVSGSNSVTIQDVLVGDVWLCSGQSNMAFPLGACNRQADIDSANYPAVRTFNVPLVTSGVPLKSVQGNWVVCSPATAGGFSAVAFYYGRRIHQEQGIPVGLIVSSVGGTKIDPWLAPDGVADIPTLHPLLSQSVLPWGPFSLFNGMIHPLAPYGIQGAIWYQGENAETTKQSADSYYLKMKALQQGWKRVWGMEDFAYYLVNLANWGTVPTDSTPVLFSGGWDADTRLQQNNAMALPHAGMASALDIGESDDMHPLDKLDLGERLALWTFKNEFEQSSLVTSGPTLKNVIVSGSKAICSFDHIGSGLMVGEKTPYQPTREVIGGTLNRFVIAGADGVWYPATAAIVGDTVELSSPSVPSPAKVSYACWQNPNGCNLYNREGLPATIFHVEDVNAKHTLTATAGAGGGISPAGTTTVLQRMTQLYTITPDIGCYVSDVKVDGISIGSVESYTFDPVYANHTIEAAFSTTPPEYTITVTAGGGGVLTPAGSVNLVQGQRIDFTAIPDSGNLAMLTVDGVELGQRSSYRFVDIRKDHNISVVFKCSIEASAGFGGSITPFGQSLIPYGGSITYQVIPIDGYVVSEVLVDGEDVGPVSSYTFSNVVQGHTIAARFTTAAGGSRGSIPQPKQVLLACRGSDLPAGEPVGAWRAYLPKGRSLESIGSPMAETVDGKTYASNLYEDGDGFRFGNSYSSPVSCHGATIVAVVRPIRNGASTGWTSIVDVFYDRLVLGIQNDSGKVCVRVNGSLDTSDMAIPDGQLTILSMVVQPNGSYKVWANGVEVMNKAGTGELTALVPGSRGFDSYINVGRNNPDGWTTFNGHIGDVFVYRNALTEAEKEELERFILTGALDSDISGDGFVNLEDFAPISLNWLDGVHTSDLEAIALNWLAGAQPLEDSEPPMPNPAAFAVAPTAAGSSSVTMTAVEGTDVSLPIEYYFDEITGHAGGSDSGWVLSPDYSDSGLASGTEYIYSLRMRDAAGNETAPSADCSVVTDSGSGVSRRIGIQFGPASAAMAQTQVAGVTALFYDQDHWNNVLGANSGRVENLIYDSGSSSGMSCSWTGLANTFNTTGSGDALLTGNFVQAGTGPATFVLSNIPYSSYDLVLYYNAFGIIYNDSRVDLDYGSDGSVDRTVYISDKDDFVSFTGSEYVEFISDISSAGAPDGANFGVVEGVAASSLTVTVSGSSFHHSLAGMQLVDNSEQ